MAVLPHMGRVTSKERCDDRIILLHLEVHTPLKNERARDGVSSGRKATRRPPLSPKLYSCRWRTSSVTQTTGGWHRAARVGGPGAGHCLPIACLLEAMGSRNLKRRQRAASVPGSGTLRVYLLRDLFARLSHVELLRLQHWEVHLLKTERLRHLQSSDSHAGLVTRTNEKDIC